MFKLTEKISVKNMVEHLGLQNISGNQGLKIGSVGSLNNVEEEGLTFSKNNRVALGNVVVVCETSNQSKNRILSRNPRLDFIRCLEWLSIHIGFQKSKAKPIIHPSVKLGKNVVIENGVSIGEDTVIEHNVVIAEGTNIGKNCLIRTNTSIGSDGFGFERGDDGKPIKFIHLGGIIIGDNVEIGACTCIAKGTLGNTVIEDNVKIDNLVHIAHNCKIQNGAFIIATSILCGGVEVGRNAWVAPNATITQKAIIGEGAIVGLGAVVTKDVDNDVIVAGNPAKFLRKIK